jgi:hypothetical protein
MPNACVVFVLAGRMEQEPLRGGELAYPTAHELLHHTTTEPAALTSIDQPSTWAIIPTGSLPGRRLQQAVCAELQHNAHVQPAAYHVTLSPCFPRLAAISCRPRR